MPDWMVYTLIAVVCAMIATVFDSVYRGLVILGLAMIIWLLAHL
jgi:hypothetical protein